MSSSESPCFDASQALKVEITTTDSEYIPPYSSEYGNSPNLHSPPKSKRLAKRLKKTYFCSTCNFLVKTKKAPERHNKTKTHSDKVKRNGHTCINCNVCKAKEMSDLTKCPLCSYTSERITSLKLHMNIHNTGSPFKCEFCEYTCQNVQCLVQHYKSSKQFLCPRDGCNFIAHVRHHFWEHASSCTR